MVDPTTRNLCTHAVESMSCRAAPDAPPLLLEWCHSVYLLSRGYKGKRAEAKSITSDASALPPLLAYLDEFLRFPALVLSEPKTLMSVKRAKFAPSFTGSAPSVTVVADQVRKSLSSAPTTRAVFWSICGPSTALPYCMLVLGKLSRR